MREGSSVNCFRKNSIFREKYAECGTAGKSQDLNHCTSLGEESHRGARKERAKKEEVEQKNRRVLINVLGCNKIIGLLKWLH